MTEQSLSSSRPRALFPLLAFPPSLFGLGFFSSFSFFICILVKQVPLSAATSFFFGGSPLPWIGSDGDDSQADTLI
jgi:hypothetical protein